MSTIESVVIVMTAVACATAFGAWLGMPWYAESALSVIVLFIIRAGWKL